MNVTFLYCRILVYTNEMCLLSINMYMDVFLFSGFNMWQSINYSTLAVTVLNSAYLEMDVFWKERTAQMSFSSKVSK